MTTLIPEKNKRPGVYYAVTDDGLEVPVIDVTHPAFDAKLDDAAIAAMLEKFKRDEQRRAKVPKPLQRLLLRLVAGRSVLGRGLMAGAGGVLGGMTMYLGKLGPENLGRGWARGVDRQIAAAAPTMLARLRLEDMARLLAEGLAPVLSARPQRPLHLFNIAGGPAADSWNALLLLRKDYPQTLSRRRISIHVLDPDESGPAFGARAIAALRAEGGPLRELDVSFRRVHYDWRDVEPLRKLLRDSELGDAVVGCSSEGGLFEYGSDEEIVTHLEALRLGTPGDSLVVGSVTRGDGPTKFAQEFTIRPRTLEAFRALVLRARWEVAKVITRPFSYNVSLRRISG
ncbi:hypothetical protein [Hyalangium versicolor]|uniref:hypothetical protein n=1 Tax=Hyalangium versicolor TaxID=2861190 RepID=UPI001CCD0012|nr:hypothetical protein [Hyalangium versicolor]